MSQIYLIGTPKSGTSSLFNGLALHPGIQGTKPKETFALLDDDHPLSSRRAFDGIQELVDAFAAEHLKSSGLSPSERNRMQSPHHTSLLEGTTHAFYSVRARREIASLGSAAHSIVMLRQPSKRILSSFLYTKNNLGRMSRRFRFVEYAELLLARDTSRIKEVINHPVSAFVLSSELELSDYAPLLRNWSEAVGRNQLRCIISEEYFKDPIEEIRSTLSWLCLPIECLDASKVVRANSTRSMKYLGVQRFARWVNARIPSSRILRPVKNVYFTLQSTSDAHEDEGVAKGLAMLDEYFRPKIDEVCSFLGRQIECWEVPVK